MFLLDEKTAINPLKPTLLTHHTILYTNSEEKEHNKIVFTTTFVKKNYCNKLICKKANIMNRIKLLFILMALAVYANATVYYVSATGDNTTGTSWSTAFQTIQGALVTATSGNEIWVAQGTYIIIGSATQLNYKDGVNVYGGFVGTEGSRTERSTDPTLTIISHETTVATSFRLLNSTELTSATVWDGFTFDGKTVGLGVKLSGNCSLINSVVKNCMVTNGSGAGVYMSTATDAVPVTLKNTSVLNNRIKVSSANTSQLGGAGVYVKLGAKLAEINGCTISNNTFEGISSTGTLEAMGAGIYIVEGIIRNCTLDQNTVTNSALSTYSNNNFTGGGIAIMPQATSSAAKVVLIDGCVITNCTSNSRGGAIVIDPRWSGQYWGNYTISNTKIINNKSNVIGGAILATAATAQTGTGFTLNLSNSVIANNSASTNAGGGIYINIGCILNITNSTIANNLAGNYGGGGIFMQGTASHTIRATFTNVSLWGNTCAGRTADVVQIQNSAQLTTFTNCAIQSYTPASTTLTGSTLTNNINLNASNTAADGPNFLLPSTTSGYGATNALTADWAITAASACLNTGSTSSVTTDIAGTTRPQGSSYDIGAYELAFYNTTITFNDGGTINSYTTGAVDAQPKGKQLSFVITPSYGKGIQSILYNGTEVKTQLTNLLGSSIYYGGTYTASALSANSTLIVTFEIDPTTGLNSNTNDFQCLLTNKKLEVRGLTIGSEVSVFTIAGLKMANKTAYSSTVSFDLPQGIYLVKAADSIKKLIVP